MYVVALKSMAFEPVWPPVPAAQFSLPAAQKDVLVFQLSI
jgi:hypothetical protein